MKIEKGSKNVFKDLGFNDAEAANLLARSDLMIALEREIKKRKLSRTGAAKLLGVKPQCISELMAGKIGKFNLDLLVVYLDRLGKTVEFLIIKKAA